MFNLEGGGGGDTKVFTQSGTTVKIATCRWKARSGVEICNMHNLAIYCVPLIGGFISRPFHHIANPNLVGRYYMAQKVTFTNIMVAMDIIVIMTNRKSN